MSGEYPEMTNFPQEGGIIPTARIGVDNIVHGSGMLVAQNSDDLRQVLVYSFYGKTPADGAVLITMDAEACKAIAEHMAKLAVCADRGVESQ